ncbi:MAG: AtpZ/AtpI family protein [Oligoflexia bacterium]|nr:AtpZ/AtpI family protein [Oligoflexia bacterium]
MRDKDADRDRAQWVRNLGLFSLIISDVLVSTGVGIGIGYLIWKKWGGPWWVLLLTSIAGLAVAMVRLYRYSERDWK